MDMFVKTPSPILRKSQHFAPPVTSARLVSLRSVGLVTFANQDLALLLQLTVPRVTFVHLVTTALPQRLLKLLVPRFSITLTKVEQIFLSVRPALQEQVAQILELRTQFQQHVLKATFVQQAQ
jgi:hypothetical protein